MIRFLSKCSVFGLTLFTWMHAAIGQPVSAVMQLGNMGTGSDFFPPGTHDQSFEAADKMVPETVVISVGGTVTFELSNPVHGVGIYAAGTEVSDVDVSMVEILPTCPPAPYINDASERLAQFAPVCGGGNASNGFQFNAPGKYLVICTFAPHFIGADMYGWVIVR